MSDFIYKLNDIIGRFYIGEISRDQAHFEFDLLDSGLADRVDIDYELLRDRAKVHPDDVEEEAEESNPDYSIDEDEAPDESTG